MVLSYHFTSENIRNYVLAKLLSSIWVLLIIEKWFKQTHCVKYPMMNDLFIFKKFTSEKHTHSVIQYEVLKLGTSVCL